MRIFCPSLFYFLSLVQLEGKQRLLHQQDLDLLQAEWEERLHTVRVQLEEKGARELEAARQDVSVSCCSRCLLVRLAA